MTPATTDRSPKTYATSLARQISFAMSIIYTRITPQTFTFLFFSQIIENHLIISTTLHRLKSMNCEEKPDKINDF